MSRHASETSSFGRCSSTDTEMQASKLLGSRVPCPIKPSTALPRGRRERISDSSSGA